jgi:hypothetical protein
MLPFIVGVTALFAIWLALYGVGWLSLYAFGSSDENPIFLSLVGLSVVLSIVIAIAAAYNFGQLVMEWIQ